jgi:hypothetical protein
MQLKNEYPSSGPWQTDNFKPGPGHFPTAVKPAFPTEYYSEAGARKATPQTKQQYYELSSDHKRRQISYQGMAVSFPNGGGGGGRKWQGQKVLSIHIYTRQVNLFLYLIN